MLPCINCWIKLFLSISRSNLGDRPNRPDLKSDADLGDQVTSGHNLPHSSTPYRTTTNPTNPLNQTFNISGILPLSGNPQDAATIVAEVSAAVAAQTLKEFWHMWKPKITKFKGGYSAETELLFRSWCVDILSHIQECKLDNKADI